MIRYKVYVWSVNAGRSYVEILEYNSDNELEKVKAEIRLNANIGFWKDNVFHPRQNIIKVEIEKGDFEDLLGNLKFYRSGVFTRDELFEKHPEVRFGVATSKIEKGDLVKQDDLKKGDLVACWDNPNNINVRFFYSSKDGRYYCTEKLNGSFPTMYKHAERISKKKIFDVLTGNWKPLNKRKINEI